MDVIDDELLDGLICVGLALLAFVLALLVMLLLVLLMLPLDWSTLNPTTTFFCCILIDSFEGKVDLNGIVKNCEEWRLDNQGSRKEKMVIE